MTGDRTAVALRYWLLGAGMHRAAEAMEFAGGYHQGLRKDGVTPEFAHQIQIAAYLRTLAGSIRHLEDTLTTAFCHDVREDYGVSHAEIDDRFGPRVAAATDALTKEFRGQRRPDHDVFAAIADDPVASVVKGADRVNNQQSMLGVFTTTKVAAYIAETEAHVLPMLRAARRKFPDQEPAYENMKLVLRNQVRASQAVIDATVTPSGAVVAVPYEFAEAAFSVVVEAQAGPKPSWALVKSHVIGDLEAAEKNLDAELRTRLRHWNDPVD